MTTGRRRDADRSRAALLAAATELFTERGYTGTGLRAVGERAGVDAALVARYFGGKEGLYRAVLAVDPLVDSPAEPPPPPPPPAPAPAPAPAEPRPHVGSDNPAALVRRAFRRWDSTGATAMSQNVFRCDADPTTRATTAQALGEDLLPRLRAMSGDPDPELRAELAAAVLLGVGVARTAGALPRLAESGADDLATIVELVVRTALG